MKHTVMFSGSYLHTKVLEFLNFFTTVYFIRPIQHLFILLLLTSYVKWVGHLNFQIFTLHFISVFNIIYNIKLILGEKVDQENIQVTGGKTTRGLHRGLFLENWLMLMLEKWWKPHSMGSSQSTFKLQLILAYYITDERIKKKLTIILK